MRELGRERRRVGVVAEVVLLGSPSRDGVDDTADELAHRALARRRAHLPAEIFLHDDVGRHLRPRRRHLDILLLEVDLAAFAGDGGGAQLPFDLIERLDADAREVARDGHSLGCCGRVALSLTPLGRAGELVLLVLAVQSPFRNHMPLRALLAKGERLTAYFATKESPCAKASIARALKWA